MPVPATPTERNMTFQAVLEENRSAVIDRWRSLILGSYPAEAARFFRSEKDRFQNPVGHSVTRATAALYDGVVLGKQVVCMPEALESLVRLRAVQDFSASQAIGFVFLLKRALRTTPELGLSEAGRWEALGLVEARIDELAAAAFDVYVEQRERIYRIRTDEMKRRIATLIRRFGGDWESEDEPMRRAEDAEPLKGGSQA
jgi:hypothetical protein